MIVCRHRGVAWRRQKHADNPLPTLTGLSASAEDRGLCCASWLCVWGWLTNRTLCAVAGSLPVCELVLRQIKDGMPVVRHQIRGNQRNLLIGVVVEDSAGEIIQLTPSFAGD